MERRGGDISPSVRRDAAVVAAHDTDDSTEEDATPDAFLARKRVDENNDDAVSTQILCDRRTNSTDQICLGSTVVSQSLSFHSSFRPPYTFYLLFPAFCCVPNVKADEMTASMTVSQTLPSTIVAERVFAVN